MIRRGVLAGLMATILFACPAHAAPPWVINGGEVATPSQAPWSVQVWSNDGEAVGRCSGSILDALHVLTAAHCAFPGEQPSPPSGYTVLAGITKYEISEAEAQEEQVRGVVGVRIPAAYRPEVIDGHDAAVLTLDAPLDLSRPGVQPIAVVPENGLPPLGSPTLFFGWGMTGPESFDRREHSLEQRLVRQWKCGGGKPTTICVQSPTASATCHGDSGGGLFLPTTPPLLIGVDSFGTTGCPPGFPDGFTDMSSPEMHQWLLGNENPPLAPEPEALPVLTGKVSVGGRVFCQAPSWSGSSRLESLFVFGGADREIETPAASGYRLRRSDRGDKISCVSIATGVGGTTESEMSTFRRVAGHVTELVRLRRRAVRHRHWVVRLSLPASLTGERLAVTWRARGCEECRRSSSVVAHRKLRLASPRRWPLNATHLVLRIPETFVRGVRFAGSSYRLWLPAR